MGVCPQGEVAATNPCALGHPGLKVHFGPGIDRASNGRVEGGPDLGLDGSGVSTEELLHGIAAASVCLKAARMWRPWL